jgi:hypothetical protein
MDCSADCSLRIGGKPVPFIIIISKIALFEPQTSLEDSARCEVCISLDFATVIFIFYRTRSSALLPTLNLEDQVPVFVAPSDRVV